MELIHQDDHDWSLRPRWRVERQPDGTTNPYLVRFIKQGPARKLLDQIAEWDPDAKVWGSRRWVPKHPLVPHTLLAIVEAHMREVRA